MNDEMFKQSLSWCAFVAAVAFLRCRGMGSIVFTLAVIRGPSQDYSSCAVISHLGCGPKLTDARFDRHKFGVGMNPTTSGSRAPMQRRSSRVRKTGSPQPGPFRTSTTAGITRVHDVGRSAFIMSSTRFLGTRRRLPNFVHSHCCH
jgi:hypothetical protein